jgi:protein ImuB
MLWLCIHFHRLPLEVFSPARQAVPETALAIVERHRICAANAAALALGVRPDMSASSALALSDTLKLREREPAHEASTLATLADWACSFSSQVSISPPDRLLLEIGASLRLFGGVASLLQTAEAEVSARGHNVHHGLGPTPLSAELFARALPCKPSAPPAWAIHHDPEAFRHTLYALPIHFLDTPGKQQLAMQRMGLARTGELFALPSAALGKRFGKDFSVYLARLHGERPDPRPLHRPREYFAHRVHFLEPIADAAMLLFPMQRLLTEMGRFLDRRQLYCQRLEWRLGMTRGAGQTLPVACSLQHNRVDALLGLTKLALEKLKLGGSVESLELACAESASLEAQAGQLFAHAQDSDPEAERLLLDRLRLRLGNERVHGIYVRDSHLPEQAWSAIQEPSAPIFGSAAPERPCWLLEKPVGLELRNGHPAWDGNLTLLSGPERIDTAWWATPHCRDYFIAQHEDGSLLWVFRERTTGQWFAQGVFG